MIRYELTNPPEDERSRELWIQHVAGFIIFKDIRKYAIERIPEDIDDSIKEQIIKGIDDSIYGLMMIFDGVTGGLQNKDYSVEFENNLILRKNGEEIYKLNIFQGDGMCMGFHGWKEDDFGEDPIVNEINIEE